MKINLKKISAVIASGLMLGLSAGVAAAENYPAPFVKGGVADVAVVYGTGAGVSALDSVQAGNIQTSLQSYMGSGTASGTTTVSGEAVELFSGGTKLYINDSLNNVKNVVTKSGLPTILADGSFSGNVDATFTQKVDIGSNPKITFARQPKSEDDPNLALTLSTTQTNYIYNTTITFNKAVNLSHADSEGEEIEMFGSKFTVGSASDTDTLVLLKSAEKLDLNSDSPSADVTIAGKTYTIELVSASDTAATIKVIDSTGTSESKEISEAASKKINGVTIAVSTADETNLKLSASIIAGSDKITLEDGAAVEIGDDDTIVDGTLIDFGTGNPNNLTTLTISVYAPESDEDAIVPGSAFVDPVYKTIKVDFSGFNIDSGVTNSTVSSRENIKFASSGDDKELLTFTDHRGESKTIQWAKNYTSGMWLMASDNGENITVLEGEKFHKGDYVVVGNEDEGYLLELTAARNQSGGVTGDKVEFKDVFSDDAYKATLTDDGAGTIEIGGKTYTVEIEGVSGITDTSYNVSLGYPDGTGTYGTYAGDISVVYPTIQTSKGAKIMFYEPLRISLERYQDDVSKKNLTELRFPNGADGYVNLYMVEGIPAKTVTGGLFNFSTSASSTIYELNVTNATGTESYNFSVGQLSYSVIAQGVDNKNMSVKLRLQNAAGTDEIERPAIVIFSEKDDNAAYEATIVEIEGGEGSTDGMGIDTVEDTWSNAASGWKATRYSDSKYEDRADLWGTLSTVYSGDSDQKTATISYPDEQIYGNLYIAEETANIETSSSSSSATTIGEILVTDTEVSSVSSKNLVIVGGSCINSAAATVLGEAACSARFTELTGVGAGQFLIKGYADKFTTGKLALLVAGYDAADTVNAATYLRNQVVDTSKEYKGTSSTTAELVTSA